jgi:drug/metabolite transporter (DMT)-like permease
MGLLVLVLSLLVTVSSGPVGAWVATGLKAPWLYLVALLQLLLGAGLIALAASGEHPELVAGAGWVAVLLGLLLVALPAPLLRRFRSQMAAPQPPRYRRLGLLLALASLLALLALVEHYR